MKEGRLKSLDALRGFDMLFICGLAGLITKICTLCGSQKGWLATQMKHVSWDGFAHHDTIFPLFLFIATNHATRMRVPKNIQIHDASIHARPILPSTLKILTWAKSNFSNPL